MALIKKPSIKSIPYEDFKDNETLEQMIDQLNAERRERHCNIS